MSAPETGVGLRAAGLAKWCPMIEADATNVLRKSSGLSDATVWSDEGYATTTGNARNFGSMNAR